MFSIIIQTKTRSVEWVFYFSHMKNVLIVLMLLCTLHAFNQEIASKKEWTPAIITLDGENIKAEISIDNRFFEGTLLVKEKHKIISLSPQNVNSFSVKETESADTLVFKSIKTTFLKRNGSKNSFLKETFQGDHFSLYSKFIPDKSSAPFIFPVGGGWVVYGVFSYIQDTEVLFLEKEGHAFQISVPKHGAYENYFTLKKKLFFEILEEKATSVKDYMKKNKKKLNYKPDIIDILQFANTLN